MKKKILAVLLAACMLGAVATGCADNATQDEPAATPEAAEEFIMGTNAEFAPFEYMEGGEIVGFDIDIANEIAKDMGKTLTINNMNFDSLISALETDMIDVVIAGMTVTEERKENVDFSEPYYSATQVIVVKKDNTEITTGADLEGKKIGVQEGTTGDIYVTDNCNAAEISRFKKAVDAAFDVTNGRLDALVIDKEPAKKIVENNEDLMVLDEALTSEEYAIAVKKGDAETLAAVNATLQRIKEDGTYMELMKKHLPEDAQALEDAQAPAEEASETLEEAPEEVPAE